MNNYLSYRFKGYNNLKSGIIIFREIITQLNPIRNDAKKTYFGKAFKMENFMLEAMQG